MLPHKRLRVRVSDEIRRRIEANAIHHDRAARFLTIAPQTLRIAPVKVGAWIADTSFQSPAPRLPRPV